jgi:hypothetical protein
MRSSPILDPATEQTTATAISLGHATLAAFCFQHAVAAGNLRVGIDAHLRTQDYGLRTSFLAVGVNSSSGNSAGKSR